MLIGMWIMFNTHTHKKGSFQLGVKTILSSEFDPLDKAGSLRDFWCKRMRFTTALYTYVQHVQLFRDLYRDFKIVIMYNYRMNPVSVALHVKSLAHDHCIINVPPCFLFLCWFGCFYV